MENTRRKFILVVGASVVYITTVAALSYFYGDTSLQITEAIGIKIWPLIWGVGVGSLIIMYRIIEGDQMGALSVLGHLVMDINSGPCLVPPGCKLHRETRNIMEVTIPAPLKHIVRVSETSDRDRSDDTAERLGPEESFPFRVVFTTLDAQQNTRRAREDDLINRLEREDPYFKEGLPKSLPTDYAEENDPFSRPVVVEIYVVLAWRIVSLVNLIRSVGSKDQAEQIMREIIQATLLRECSKVTYRTFLSNLGFYSLMIRAELRERIEALYGGQQGSGVLIANTATFTQHNHPLNTAITAVPTAKYDAQKAVETAHGEREKRRLEGEGNAQAEQAMLDRRGQGLHQQAVHLGVSPAAALATETTRAVAVKEGQTIVIGTAGLDQLVGVGKTIMDSSARFSGTEKSPQESDQDNEGRS